MQSLNSYLWEKQKAFFVSIGILILSFFLGSFVFGLALYKDRQLAATLHVLNSIVNETLKVGDWALVHKQIEANIGGSEIYQVSVLTASGTLIAGPIGASKFGLAKTCSTFTPPNTVGIQGCINILSAFDFFGVIIILGVLAALMYSAFVISRSKVRRIFIEIENNLNQIVEIKRTDSLGIKAPLPIKELVMVFDKIKTLVEKVDSFARTQALIDVTKQVSHDVRSPLAALNMIIGQIQNIPEDQRLMLRRSVNRINDIANMLLNKSKEQSERQNSNKINEQQNSKPLQVELLPALMDSIVSEKRVQFRDKIGIEIEADLVDSYGAFANINATELARVVSNITNNSLEAMPEGKGKFTLTVRKEKDFVEVIAKDNGKGIPPHILEKLGQEGVTHGKEGTQSGSGLGVYHAKKTVESSGGQFLIESKQGHGTTITMSFPAVPPPKWFVEKLILPPGTQVISLDDDISIHSVWQGRFQSLNIRENNIEHLTFTSGQEFKEYCHAGTENAAKIGSRVYLVDYELLNQKNTGLEIIEELGIAAQAILVTSRYEEAQIRDKCERLGVKLIPKGMACYVPVEIAKQKQRYDALLLDDDSLNEMTWKMAASDQGKTLLYFSNPSDFFSKAADVDFKTPLFIDSNLGNGIKGEEIAKQAFEIGFKTIFICTGYDPGEFPSMPWIVKVIGKDPYFP